MSWLSPRPASFQLTVREPLLSTLPVADTKCGEVANAAGTASAPTARHRNIPKRSLRIVFPPKREQGRFSRNRDGGARTRDNRYPSRRGQRSENGQRRSRSRNEARLNPTEETVSLRLLIRPMPEHR